MNYHTDNFNAILFWSATLQDVFEQDFYDYCDKYKEKICIENTLNETKLIDYCIQFASNNKILFNHCFNPDGVIVLFFYPEELNFTKEMFQEMAKNA